MPDSSYQENQLAAVLREIDPSAENPLSLMPLFPGSLTLRQAYVGPIDRSNDDGLILARQNSKRLLTPIPHAWYLANRAVPDQYLEPIKAKERPYILIKRALLSADVKTYVASLLNRILSEPCNILIESSTHVKPESNNLHKSYFDSSIDVPLDIYDIGMPHTADALSLTRHASFVIGCSVEELADAIALNVPCFWLNEDSSWNLSEYTPGHLNSHLEANRNALTQYANSRLEHHVLIETRKQLFDVLANASANVSEDTGNNSDSNPIADGPIMPIIYSSPSVSKKQQHALKIARLKRKLKKFMESPKRFFADSKHPLFRSFK